MILICCSSDCRGPPNGGDPIDPTRLDVDSWPVATPASGRQLFLDGLRGLALIFMVLNHTGRWWIERPLGWPRYHLVYLTVTLAAPIFLFLVGFCLPLSYLNSTLTRGERYVSVAWKYVRRGARLVVAGWFLNLLVFPDEPLFAGGVLQTIGLSIVGLTLLLPVLRSSAGWWTLLAAALWIHASFALAHPFLRRWLPQYPVLADVLFYDFPLCPWFAVALLGLVLGWVWAEGQRRGDDDRRYFEVMSVAGVLCLGAFLGLELAVGATPHFFSGRDLVLNHHWNPGGLTCLWILRIIFSLLPAADHVVKVRRVQAPRLVGPRPKAPIASLVHPGVAPALLPPRFRVLLHSLLPLP